MLENAVDKCLKGGQHGSVVCMPAKRGRGAPAPGARPRGQFPRETPPEGNASEESTAPLIPGKQGTWPLIPGKQGTVIGSNSGKVYAGRSLFCLAPGNQPRKLAICILETRFFDPIILLTIAVRRRLVA